MVKLIRPEYLASAIICLSYLPDRLTNRVKQKLFVGGRWTVGAAILSKGKKKSMPKESTSIEQSNGSMQACRVLGGDIISGRQRKKPNLIHPSAGDLLARGGVVLFI